MKTAAQPTAALRPAYGLRGVDAGPLPVPVAVPPERPDPASQEQLDRCRENLILGKALMEGYEEELFGHPIPWPADTLPKYRSERYTAVVNQAIEQAAAEYDSATFECSEFPCIAALRVPQLMGRVTDITMTPIWRKQYWYENSRFTFRVIACPNFGLERLAFVSVRADPNIDFATMDSEEIFRIVDSWPLGDNREKRWEGRIRMMLETWTCLPTATRP